jgi:hypothetical protein
MNPSKQREERVPACGQRRATLRDHERSSLNRKTLIAVALGCVLTLVAAPAQAINYNHVGFRYTLPEGFKIEQISMKGGAKANGAWNEAAQVGALVWSVPKGDAGKELLEGLLKEMDAVLEGTNCGGYDLKRKVVNTIPTVYYACAARAKKNQKPVGVQVSLYNHPANARMLVILLFWAKDTAAANKTILAQILGSVTKQ